MNFGFVDLFIIFFITLGPLKSAIVYTALTTNADKKGRRKIAIKTVTTATFVTILFVFAGEFLLDVFHVSLPALKMAGGLILLLFALEMVIGSASKGNNSDYEGAADVSVYPLALPLMATPQGLVAIITVCAAIPGTLELISVIGSILTVMAINLLFFLGAHRILGFIGPAALNVVARIVGLLLVALAVQLIIWGLIDLGALETLDATH